MDPITNTANEGLINFNWTVDNVQQGDKILLRFDDDRLTEAKIISNHKEVPEPSGSIRYDTVLLDTFVGLNVKEWDRHTPMTTFLKLNGEYDHSVKTGAATAAGASV